MSLFRALAPVICTFALVGHALADEVKPEKKWMGRITRMQDKNGIHGPIFNKNDLEKVWKEWEVKGDVPKVDFSREFLVAITASGSGHGFMAQLNEESELTTIFIATDDFTFDMGYTIALFKREGVKTVNGRPLPKQ